MPKLSVHLTGLEMKSPTILAAGIPFVVRTGERLSKAAEEGAGAISTKTIYMKTEELTKLVSPRFSTAGRLCIQNNEWMGLEPEQWVKEISVMKRSGVPVIASIVGTTLDEWVQAAKLAEEAGADMVEPNVSFPATDLGEFGIEMPEGSPMGYYPLGILRRIVKTVRDAVSIPVMPKLPGTKYDDIGPAAKVAEDAGADAVAAMNSIPNTIGGVDIETGELLVAGTGCYSGAGIKPMSLGATARMAMSVKIPVVGVGGVASWRDAAEMIMLGATAVGICTAAIYSNFKVFRAVNRGLEDFMTRKGYGSVEDFRGTSLRHIKPINVLVAENRANPIVFHINAEKCNGCGRCVPMCPYECIRVDAEMSKASVDEEICDGCGMCAMLCPEDAVYKAPAIKK